MYTVVTTMLKKTREVETKQSAPDDGVGTQKRVEQFKSKV
jgi:hypothetical protein